MSNNTSAAPAAQNWESIRNDIHAQGYALLPDVLDAEQCAQLIADYPRDELYRKTVVMERHRYGLGEYRYYRYPLPPLVAELRRSVYAELVPLANAWMDMLKLGGEYPPEHSDFTARCHSRGQELPTALILKYGPGGHNTMHQDLYGEVWFPLQMAVFLNESGKDYTGGEFVLTQQTPRAQSVPIVLRARRGAALIFTTNFRPVQGSRGYYRVNMKHGVSKVHSGARHTLGIIFHDALS